MGTRAERPFPRRAAEWRNVGGATERFGVYDIPYLDAAVETRTKGPNRRLGRGRGTLGAQRRRVSSLKTLRRPTAEDRIGVVVSDRTIGRCRLAVLGNHAFAPLYCFRMTNSDAVDCTYLWIFSECPSRLVRRAKTAR